MRAVETCSWTGFYAWDNAADICSNFCWKVGPSAPRERSITPATAQPRQHGDHRVPAAQPPIV